jgi:SAM-dependent methyltransferase
VITANRQQPFDALADGYDETFTHSITGQAQRRAVHRRLDARLAAGARVIALGCGTGEDAVYLARRGLEVLATDPSAPMLEAARRKATAAGVGDAISWRRMAAEGLAALAEDGAFDAAFSNFGALNCTADLAAVAHELARLVRPGGTAILCLLGRWSAWEWLWFLLHGQPRSAFRRLRPGGLPWRGTRVRYPPLRQVRRDFSPTWRLVRAAGIGTFVPPSYAEPWARRHPRLVTTLDRLERRIESLPPISRLGDHVLLEFERP